MIQLFDFGDRSRRCPLHAHRRATPDHPNSPTPNEHGRSCRDESKAPRFASQLRYERARTLNTLAPRPVAIDRPGGDVHAGIRAPQLTHAVVGA